MSTPQKREVYLCLMNLVLKYLLELKNGFLIQKVRHILKYISQDNFINHQPLISEECDNNVIDKDKKMSMTHK